MVDSDQNEPENDKNHKNDKNESSDWNLADYLIGETPAHHHDASPTETEAGSQSEPSAETEIRPQDAVHTETSSLFEPSGDKQTHSTYPVYTEPSSHPEPSSETEIHLQDAFHAEASPLIEPSGETETHPQEAVHTETSSPFEVSGVEQTHSTYPVYAEPSSQPEPSAETEIHLQDAFHAEASPLIEPSAGMEIHPQDTVQTEASTPSYVSTEAETHRQEVDHAEASPLVEPSAETEFRWQEAVQTEGGTPSYVSTEAEIREQNPASTDSETDRHDEPAETMAADEPRTEPVELHREDTKPPIANPEVIPPADPAEPEKRRTNLAFVFAAAAIAVLVAIAGAFIAIYWQQLNSVPTADSAQAAPPPSPTDARDLGTVDSSAVGLKGHLTTKWDGSLAYSFVIEPDDPARQAAFAMTVSNPPRAASVTIQIKNADGVVMCTQDVLLRFDPRRVAAINEAPPEKPARRPLGAKTVAATEEKREAELDGQVAAETEREHGKSMFQINTGQNGTIESISSQGEIPCPQSVYEGMGYWSFLPDFPTPAEQTAWVNHQPLVPAKVEATEASASEANRPEAKKPAPQPAAHTRMTYKAAAVPGTFSIAGDDAIVEYDASAGHIGTRAGKLFSIDKAGAEAHAIQGYDLPVTIHYRCDQFAACTLTHGGAVIARAKLSQ